MLRVIVLVLLSSFFVFTRTTGLLHKKPTDKNSGSHTFIIIIKFQRSSNFLGASNQVANRGRRKPSQNHFCPKKARRESLFLALFLKISLFSLVLIGKNLNNRPHNKTKSSARAAFAKHPLNSPSALSSFCVKSSSHLLRAHTHKRLSLISLSLV